MATRLPSGNYRTQVFTGYKDGRRQYKSFVAETARKADLAALQWQSEHPSDSLTGMTVKRAVAAYIELKKAVLSPSTVRGYTTIEKMLNERYPKFVRLKLEDVTRDNLQKLVNDLSADARPKTVKNYYFFLAAILRYHNMPVPRVTLPSRIRPSLNIPDEDTLQHLFKAAQGTDIEVPILLGAIGPMRRGEIVAASMSDLDGCVLHVHRAAVVGPDGRQTIKDYPKTDSSDRHILLPQSVVDKINAQGYICNLTLRQVTDHFRRLLAHEGIEHFRFHDLRHAFVSIAHAAGLPDAYIQERGGWSTNYTMNNVYRHTLTKDRAEEQTAVNNVFDRLM